MEAYVDLERECLDALRSASLETYFDDAKLFFANHLALYTASKRTAPIYWPLSTNSGSYTLWLYYPNLTSQTLFSAVNDFVEPKLKQVSREAEGLRNKGSARSRDDEKSLEALHALELELIELRDTLLQIAPTYRPRACVDKTETLAAIACADPFAPGGKLGSGATDDFSASAVSELTSGEVCHLPNTTPTE